MATQRHSPRIQPAGSGPIAVATAPRRDPGLRVSGRIVTIDWMRGLVMLLMVVDQASMAFEQQIGFRPNGIVLVFGQTAMFFYLVHRLAFEVPATYFGLRGAGTLTTTYVVSAVAIVTLYPACRWYRAVKTAHPTSLLQYL